MTISHNLGFPRIGAHRELKRAVEAYWKGDIDRAALEQTGRELRKRHWQLQAKAGIDLIPVNDFSWYDHMLDMSALLGVVPERFGHSDDKVDLDTYFRMARGRAPTGKDAPACEMTKWFDTNYHYIVPEFNAHQAFKLSSTKLFDELTEARTQGYNVKPVLVGPLTYLWLGKAKGKHFDKLGLLDKLLPAYVDILEKLAQQQVEWVQIDEPALVLDLPQDWRDAFKQVYEKLSQTKVKILLATYFGALGENTALACDLPVAGLHVDLVRAPDQLKAILNALPKEKILSAGVVDGRNIWRTDVEAALHKLAPAEELKERLWVAPSCSLLHTPVDLTHEVKLDAEIKSWLAFAAQKCDEIVLIKRAQSGDKASVAAALEENARAIEDRRNSKRIHKDAVAERVSNVDASMADRNSPYENRAQAQKKALNLPLFPTTTIGSFPQTKGIRAARRDFKTGKIDEAAYTEEMKKEIAHAVKEQEELNIDVLVHGEAERNDMVEYFGELLDGFAFTQNGWVQSYGSRCVKPPVIYGDVSRPKPMTVEWSAYAQSLTKQPMKGMLTGPVTILQWSFVRDDQSRAQTCLQIALALRDEVVDLEKAGIKVIQIDEPAVREGLPLRRKDWQTYLDWAVRAFRVSASGVQDDTQIHTHMCYSEFNDIIESIAALDADVISIETSRSQMELLEVFRDFEYPNEIGPGVYDIHSPRVPSGDEMADLLKRAAEHIPAERLWVNPDCGLKTRDWAETRAALKNMVNAAQAMRQHYKKSAAVPA